MTERKKHGPLAAIALLAAAAVLLAGPSEEKEAPS